MLLLLLEERQSSALEPQNGTDHQAAYQLEPAYAQFRDQSRFWIQRVAVPLLMVIGLFGNLITVIIMTRRRMRSTTNMYLAALAFVDMLYLVLTFLLGLSHYPNMAANKYYAYWKLRPFLMMLTDACSNTSVWLTVTFTIERYIAVKYPMKGKVWCTEARAKMLIVFVFAFAILFAAPVPFEWTVIEKRTPTTTPVIKHQASMEQLSHRDTSNPPSHDLNNNNNNDALGASDSAMGKSGNNQDYTLALDYSDFGRNETYKTIYYWSTAVIFYFIPLFSLMLFNGFLIKSVRHSERERRRMTRASVVVSKQSSVPTTTTIGSDNNRAPAPESDQPSSRGPNDHKESSTHGYKKKFKLHLSTSKQKMNCTLDDSSTVEESRFNNSPTIVQNEADANDKRQDRSQVSEKTALRNPSRTHLDHRISFIEDRLAVESQQNLDANPVPDSPYGETNVLTNCDHVSVTREADKRVADSVNHRTMYSDEVSIQNRDSSFGGQKTTNDANGRLSTRPSPLRRSQITNASSRSHHSMAPASTQERRITIMLIAVVILFLVCQIPSAAMILYSSVNEPEPNTNEHALVLAFGNIFNFLMAVNAAGNFILYSFLSKKYRRTFIILFCSCFGSKMKAMEARRTWSSRYETVRQSVRNQNHHSSMYQGNKSEKGRSDTQV